LLHAASGEKESGSSDSHAPVVLVGTHYDKIKDLPNDSITRRAEKLSAIHELIIEELKALEIRVAFKDTPKEIAKGGAFLANSDEKLCYWPIDNSDSDDKNVRKLRVHLRHIVLSQEYVNAPVPIPWLEAIDTLVDMSKKEPLVPLEAKGDSETVSVVDVLRKCGALVDENGNLIGSERSIVVSFLKFCNGPGIFVYFDGIQGLQDYCILNPQWILDQATYVVRDFKLHRFPRDYAAMELNCGESWTSLLKRGILDLPLLQKLWRGEDQSRVDFLLNFMIKIGIFGVLPRKTAGVEDEGSRLIVPGVITSSNFHLQGRQVSTLLSKMDQHVSIDNASNGERRYTESFTFKNFLPTGFYDRLVTTFVSDWVQDQSEYQDPELFPDGCLLYCMESEDETRVNEPFAIHLKINSIDIITSSDGFMASILPQVATAMDKINKEIYNSGLKYHSPEVPPEVSPKKDTRSVYRNATQIEKEYNDIALKDASKDFSDFFQDCGCESDDADRLAITIINKKSDMRPIKLKKLFELILS
jgi:hypothetical protein